VNMESTTRDYGTIDAWNFYNLSESKQIQLRGSDEIGGDVDCFLHLLFSNSSTEIEYVEIYNVGSPWVVLRLWGPVADDQGRLSTEFKLYSYHLHRHLPIKEERYAVVRRLHELGGTGEEFKEACKTLRVSKLGLS
jgi:hypothetical protein